MIAKQESKVGSDCEGGKRRRASAGGSIASPPLNGVLSPAVIHDNRAFVDGQAVVWGSV